MTKLFQKYLFLLMICSPAWCLAQTNIGYAVTGVVRDAISNETLPFASVFFSGTTFGTTSDRDGNFTLRADKSGTYDLVISFTGFGTFFRQVDLNKPQELRLEVALSPEVKNLGAVIVTAKKDEKWAENLAVFKRTFLGTSRFAKSCKILNEEVLNFYYEPKKKIFQAYADEPLIIENKALGYKIKYLLEDFSISYRTNYSIFYGFLSFEDMNKEGKSKKKWVKKRVEAYNGSSTHFFKALYEGTIDEEGFEVNRAKDIKGGGRAIDLTPVRMSQLVKTRPNDPTKTLSFEYYLYVVYENEKESLEYKSYQGVFGSKAIGREQLSWIFMPEGIVEVAFESSGYLINPLGIVTNGYWGFEKLGDMLPTDYEPGKQ